MPGFNDVVAALDRTLGNNTAFTHGAFWRGKTRDEFVAHDVFGFPVIEVGNAATSNLVLALRGQTPFGDDLTPRPPGAFMPRMPAFLDPADEADIILIETWINAGCPEVDDAPMVALSGTPASDNDHIRFWRELDLFFLPTHASAETQAHVNNWHFTTMGIWLRKRLGDGSDTRWEQHIADPQNIASFEFIRLHKRLGDIHDSLWKFGADLLPPDPSSGAFPEHRMDGVRSWFAWSPYLEMSLMRNDQSDVDLALAQGWQMGIAGDGLLRKDRPRPIDIPDFDATAPNLRDQVIGAYEKMQRDDLLAGMVARARTVFSNGTP